MTHSDGGKGSTQRPTNFEAFDKHFEEIFGKKAPKGVADGVTKQLEDAKAEDEEFERINKEQK